MIKGISVYLLVLLAAVQANNLHRHDFIRSLPPEFMDAEMVSTPGYLLLKLRQGRQVKLLTVPDVYQFYNYSSGHSCLEAIFSYYQFPTDAVKYRETVFIADGDFDQNNFASPDKLVQAAYRLLNKETLPDRKDVFQIQIKQGLIQTDLIDLISRGIPPILLITKDKATHYGSYVIVIGHDQNNYYIEDPYKMGSIAYLPKQELETIWHNTYAGIKATRLAILVQLKDQRRPEEYPLVRPSP